jgi:iron-regulated transporter 1
MGSAAVSFLESRFGTSRTAYSSLWFANLTLSPAIITFFVPYDPPATDMPVWNTIIMMSGIILTRGGSTAFSLAQIKQLQQSLAAHLECNRLTALQSALGYLFDLLRFVLTLVFSTTELFKWTAAITMTSPCCIVNHLYCLREAGEEDSALTVYMA